MRLRDPAPMDLRVLVLAPLGRDAELTCEMLAKADIVGVPCASVVELRDGLVQGAGAAVVAEEALAEADTSRLEQLIARQPSWSDLPILLLTHPRQGTSERLVAALGNVVLIERPMRLETLLSTVRATLRARRRQYQLRDQLEQQRRIIRHLEETRAELRESERWFRLVAEELPQIVWTAAPDGRGEYFNQRFADYTGRRPPKSGAHEWAELLLPDDLTRTCESWVQTVREGRPWRIEHRIRRKDGVYRWHLTRALPVRDGKGQITRWFGTATDIHEGKEQEEQLRESQERLRAALVASKTGTFRWDLRTDALDWDRSLDQLFGLARGETVTTFDEFVARIHPDDRPAAIEAASRSREHGHPFEIVFRVVQPDGAIRWLADKGRAFPGEDGAPAYMTGACVDITEQREAAEKLRRSNAALRRSNEDLNQFAYAASHDLQEPMRMVAVYSELLARRYEGRLDAEADRYIGYVVTGARRMIGLLRRLLQYARSAEDDAPSTETRVAADDVLGEVLSSLERAIADADARVTSDPLPEVPIRRVHLVQVLQNLVGNAIKYRGDAPPLVHVAAREADGVWTFSVRDNGIGIDPRFAGQAFGLFRRLHGDQFPGTGIGLAICSKIVHRYGGRIWVDPGPEGGSVFSFTLPSD